MDAESYIKLLKELNDARLSVIKAQDARIKALEEIISLKDAMISLVRGGMT